MKLVRGIVACAVAMAMAFSLGGCGAAQKAATPSETPLPSADTLWTAAKASMTAAKSVHIKGTVLVSGTESTIDIAGVRDGSNSKLLIGQSGSNAEIIAIANDMYIKADASYWKLAGVGDNAIAVIGSKYVKTAKTSTNDMKIDTLLSELQQTNMNLLDKLNLKVEKTDVAGVPAYLVTQRVATTNEDDKFWITADDKSNLLKLTTTGGTDPCDLTFSEWDSVASFTAPAQDQVIEM